MDFDSPVTEEKENMVTVREYMTEGYAKFRKWRMIAVPLFVLL